MNYNNTMLSYYLNNIKNFPVLSREEEKYLAKKARNGDERARQKMMVCNLKFVVIVAKKYLNSGIPLIDLISEGNLGLIKAIENFDERKGYHLISYAVHWIKQSIIKAIADKSKIVRLPLSWNNYLYFINREYGSGDLKENKTNTLSMKLGIKEDKIKNLLKISKNHLSLESQVIHNGSEKGELVQCLKDEKSLNPEKSLMDKSIKGDMAKALNYLSSVEKKVIVDRFGLGGKRGKKLIEIGEDMKLTKERVRQIEKKGLDKLKEHMKQMEINQYLTV